MLIRKINSNMIKSIHNIRDFYIRSNLYYLIEQKKIQKVEQVRINPQLYDKIASQIFDQYVQEQQTIYTNSELYKLVTDWLCFAPVSDDEVPDNEVWVFLLDTK